MRIEKAFCLSLDKRQEDWSKLETEVQSKLNLKLDRFICGKGDFDLEYDHVDIPKPMFAPFRYGKEECIVNHYNAFLCHKKMAQQCLDEGVENCLFLEDDAYLTNRFVHIWENTQSYLDEWPWDLCYLGWWMVRSDLPGEDRPDLEKLWAEENSYGIKTIDRPPFLINEISGLHGLLVNKTMFEFIAKAPYGPIDSYLGVFMDRIKAFYIWPKIIHVGPGWSYCENSFTDRNVI